MEITRILEALEYLEPGEFPREALKAAVAQREAITPHLLQALENPSQVLNRLADEETYMLPFYAFYLLAQFREQRAYPLIVDFFSQPGDLPLDVTGDFVTEDLGRVLASVSGGEVGPMQEMVEDPAINEYIRAAAMDGMLTLVAEDVIPRATLIAYFRQLFHGTFERTWSFMWDALVGRCTDLYPEELMPEIRQAFEDDLIDEGYIDLYWVRKVLAAGKEAALRNLRNDRHYQFINDTVRLMEGWISYQAPPPPPEPAPQPAPPPKKVGRNDPCPCGSGIKYKYCCGKRY
jgi:hypothetical protein